MPNQNENLSDRLQRVLGVHNKDLTDDQLIEHVQKLNTLARQVVINNVHAGFWLDRWVPEEDGTEKSETIRDQLNRAAHNRGEAIRNLEQFYRVHHYRDDTETAGHSELAETRAHTGAKQ